MNLLLSLTVSLSLSLLFVVAVASRITAVAVAVAEWRHILQFVCIIFDLVYRICMHLPVVSKIP